MPQVRPQTSDLRPRVTATLRGAGQGMAWHGMAWHGMASLKPNIRRSFIRHSNIHIAKPTHSEFKKPIPIPNPTFTLTLTLPPTVTVTITVTVTPPPQVRPRGPGRRCNREPKQRWWRWGAFDLVDALCPARARPRPGGGRQLRPDHGHGQPGLYAHGRARVRLFVVTARTVCNVGTVRPPWHLSDT